MPSGAGMNTITGRDTLTVGALFETIIATPWPAEDSVRTTDIQEIGARCSFSRSGRGMRFSSTTPLRRRPSPDLLKSAGAGGPVTGAPRA